MIPKTIQTWQMTEPGKLVRTEIPMPALGPGEALVEIRGCGFQRPCRNHGGEGASQVHGELHLSNANACEEYLAVLHAIAGLGSQS